MAAATSPATNGRARMIVFRIVDCLWMGGYGLEARTKLIRETVSEITVSSPRSQSSRPANSAGHRAREREGASAPHRHGGSFGGSASDQPRLNRADTSW